MPSIAPRCALKLKSTFSSHRMEATYVGNDLVDGNSPTEESPHVRILRTLRGIAQDHLCRNKSCAAIDETNSVKVQKAMVFTRQCVQASLKSDGCSRIG
jgi:hypothetical protein